MAQTGKTTGNLKLRSGPGLQFEPPVAYLEPDTALEVLGEDGDWLHVRAGGQEGYVGKKFVALSGSAGDGSAGKDQAAPAAPAAGSDIAKRSAPPAQKSAGGSGKAHKGVEEE